MKRKKNTSSASHSSPKRARRSVSGHRALSVSRRRPSSRTKRPKHHPKPRPQTRQVPASSILSANNVPRGKNKSLISPSGSGLAIRGRNGTGPVQSVKCNLSSSAGKKMKGKGILKGIECSKVEEKESPLCGICLSDENSSDGGKLDSCDHFFCYGCILQWSKVESRCPMCKQRFFTIFRSSDGCRAKIDVPVRDQVYEPSEEDLQNIIDPYDNVLCMECHETGDEALLLLCDCCDSAAHTYCVGLGNSVPRGDWYCQSCQGLLPSDHADEGINIDLSDEQWADLGTFLVASLHEVHRNVDDDISRSMASPLLEIPLRRSYRRNQQGDATESLADNLGSARTLLQHRRLLERIQQLRENWDRLDEDTGSTNSEEVSMPPPLSVEEPPLQSADNINTGLKISPSHSPELISMFEDRWSLLPQDWMERIHTLGNL